MPHPASGGQTPSQAELDLLADGREYLERWSQSPRFRYLYPEGPNLAILLEAYQVLDRRRVVGRIRRKPKTEARALRRIIRRLAHHDAIARQRRLLWRYPPARLRPPRVQPPLVHRALGQVDLDAQALVQARITGDWAPPDPGTTLTTEATREQRGLDQFRDALVNEALAHPDGLARLHPQFLLFATSAAPLKRRYPIASFLLVKLPFRLVMGLFILLTTLYLSAYALFNDERLGSFVGTQVSGLVEGELEMGSIHWELPLIVDLITGTPTHVVVEDVSIWEAYDSFGGERTRRTAFARRLEANLVLHEIIPWNRLGVPPALEIPWVLHFTDVQSENTAWFIVREYDDVDDEGQTHTLMSLLDAFRPVEPGDGTKRGLSFQIDHAEFHEAILDVDFMHGLEGWRALADIEKLSLALGFESPPVEVGTPPILPLRFDVGGTIERGSFALDDIEVPLADFELERLSCGMNETPLGDVGFMGQGGAGGSPLTLRGTLRDAFTRALQPELEPLPGDADVTWGDSAYVVLDAGSHEPAELASHIEGELGLAPDTLSAEDAALWARVEGPLSDTRFHVAAEGLSLDLMGEPAWTMDDVLVSVGIETAPVPDRWRDQLPHNARRLVARFDTFEGSALDGSFSLDPDADEGAVVVFPGDSSEAYLISAPLKLDGINPAQLSPDDQELSQTLAGQADGRLDLRRLELGPPLASPDDEEPPADGETDEFDDEDEDELGLRVAEFDLGNVLLVRDRGPRDDGMPHRVRADGRILIDDRGAIDFDDLVLRTDGTQLRTTGGVDGDLARLEQTLLQLEITDGAAFSRAFALPPYFKTLSADFVVDGSTGAPNGRDGNLLLAGVGVQGGTKTRATMSMNRGVLEIKAPKAELFGGKGAVQANITLFEGGTLLSDPRLSGSAELRGVRIEDLVDAEISGVADIKIKVGDAQGGAQPLSKLEVRGEARIPLLRFGGTRYRDVYVEFEVGPEELKIIKLELPVHRALSPLHDPNLAVAIGMITAKGTVGLSKDPELDLEVEAEGVPLRLVARLLEIDVPVRGRIGKGTSLTVNGSVSRPSAAGTVALSGLSASGIALGDGTLEVTSEDLPAEGPLAAHRELRVGGELRTPEGRDGGIQWTVDALIALAETRRGSSSFPPLDAEVDVRFDRISIETLLRGLARGTDSVPQLVGRLEGLGAHVLTCDPGAAMISDCLTPHEQRSLEVSLQLDKAWLNGREPTTADPCRDPASVCTSNDLQATIDWPKIDLDHPWVWQTGGREPAELTLDGNFDLSDPDPTRVASKAEEEGAPACRPLPLKDFKLEEAPDGVAQATLDGELDLSVIAELAGSDTLRKAKGRLGIELRLTGPAAETRLSGHVHLPDAAPGATEPRRLELDLGGELGFPVNVSDDLDIKIGRHWLGAKGTLQFLGESLTFGEVAKQHSGFAFGGACEGHYGLAVKGTVGARLLNTALGDGTVTQGVMEIPRLLVRGNAYADDPLEEARAAVRIGRKSLTVAVDDGLPPVELQAGEVDIIRCSMNDCPAGVAEGAIAVHVGGTTGSMAEGRPSSAIRAKIGPRGSAFAWGSSYFAPDFASVDATWLRIVLEDVPYRGYDQRGRPVYEAEASSPMITLRGGNPLVVSGGIDVERARYVQNAVQGVEILRFTDDVDLPSAPPPEIIRDLQFDLRVATRSPLRIENNVAHGVEADAVVDVTGSYERPEFTGRVDVEPGGTVDIPFLTGTYEIQRGRITLLRELADAEVDVLALRRELVYIDDTPRQVHLLLGGTADAITWQCIAEGDTSGAVDTQRGCLDYLVLGAGDVQDSSLNVQRTGGGGLANARKPLQVVGHVTEFDFGRRIEEAAPRFGPYVPDVRLRLGQIGPELEIATPEEWLDFDYVQGTAALDYTRGYPGFLLQQSRELTFKLEAIDLLIFEISRDIRSYLNNRIIFDPLQQTTVEFRVDFEIPSLR